MDESNMTLRDKINYLLFTMTDEQLLDVLSLIEDYLGQDEE